MSGNGHQTERVSFGPDAEALSNAELAHNIAGIEGQIESLTAERDNLRQIQLDRTKDYRFSGTPEPGRIE